MTVIQTGIDSGAEGFKANRVHMQSLVGDLNSELARVVEGGPAAAREKHLARGKLLPRERIRRLIDLDSPFLELSPLAGLGLYEEPVPAGGVISGIGVVHGRPVLVVVNDATVKGGAYYPIKVTRWVLLPTTVFCFPSPR